jgi:hypothetical protein
MTQTCQPNGAPLPEKTLSDQSQQVPQIGTFSGQHRSEKRTFSRPCSGLFSQIMISLLILLFSIPVSAAGEEGHGDSYSPGVKRGERLFYGLVEGKFTGNACADCHNTMEIDTFNWNPNAWEIAYKYKSQSTEDFTKAVMNPTGKTMAEVHTSFNLNEAEIILIKEFLDHFEEEGLTKQNPIINKILLFFLLGALLTWIVIDVVFLKKVKRKWILGLLFIGALGWQVQLLLEAGIALGRQENYEPDQPIKFSHMVHVTDNQIDCNYCHHTVTHSKTAGFPETELCMNCHIIVREGTNSGRYEINKLVQAHETGEHIEWIRVHNLQDHAFFSHAQHVTVGGLDCQECHGPVEETHRVSQVSDLSMGWCINCHRDTEVQFFDNAFYAKYEEVHEAIKTGEIDRVTADLVGGTDCSKCHY